jgi:hypothetical protein
MAIPGRHGVGASKGGNGAGREVRCWLTIARSRSRSPPPSQNREIEFGEFELLAPASIDQERMVGGHRESSLAGK